MPDIDFRSNEFVVAGDDPGKKATITIKGDLPSGFDDSDWKEFLAKAYGISEGEILTGSEAQTERLETEEAMKPLEDEEDDFELGQIET